MSDESVYGLDFDATLAEDLQDEEFRREYERLKPGYEIACLRMKRGLTQRQLARLVGTRQSSISRLETGEHEPSLSFLRRVARALNAEVTVSIVESEHEQKATAAGDTVYSMAILPGYGIAVAQASVDADTTSDTVIISAPPEAKAFVK